MIKPYILTTKVDFDCFKCYSPFIQIDLLAYFWVGQIF